MKEIAYKDILNCVGRKVTLENEEGKKTDIHITSAKGNMIYGTGVGKLGKIRYEGNINFKPKEVYKIYT